MSNRYYTGVGSRETPIAVQYVMVAFARMMANRGWVLRSGGADGADKAFEKGCDQSNGDKEIYLPWFRFNGSSSRLHKIPEWAYEQASELHPRWQYLKGPVRKLHARNVLQVMGSTPDAPVSELLVCWTSTGLAEGGTATAMNLADQLGVPIVNLYFGERALVDLRKWCPGL